MTPSPFLIIFHAHMSLGQYLRRGLLTLIWIAIVSPLLGDVSCPHLAAAEDLVQRLDLSATDYTHGAFDVSWDTPPHCYADCSGFLDALLMHVYGFKRDNFYHWLGSRRPNAAAYYATIRNEHGFEVIARLDAVQPGDILAIYYVNHTENSGHILIADGRPESMPSKPPIKAGLQQWQVPVIDCSESGHGPKDTRHKKGSDGKDHTGLGRGFLRLYCDSKGQISGFTWSTLNVSAFKSSDVEPLIIGRLDPHFRP